MQNRINSMIKKLAEVRKAIDEKRSLGPEHLKTKDKDKLSKIRNNIKRNSKKKTYPA